jgi:hypothetical protein
MEMYIQAPTIWFGLIAEVFNRPLHDNWIAGIVGVFVHPSYICIDVVDFLCIANIIIYTSYLDLYLYNLTILGNSVWKLLIVLDI